MSSPKLNLPMLDDYLLGEMISEHDGVHCYPAIRRGTEEKYIVKVISIPSSPTRLEALLLTGALSGKEAALAYFMELSQDVLKQSDILHQLSHQEGFVPYLDGQITPIEGEVGYHVYLLGTYKHSLERILGNEVITHSEAINMALDLCAALAACRRAGYLYVDLKPGNVYYDPEQGYRIGDVGFIALSSLKYASLPDKYRSSYTAPELADDFAVLNPTVDVYALGLVLYQVYNGGILPYGGHAPDEILPPPMYADYEMAQIILNACHPDPQQRYQEPTQMAQALIGYMQTFGASEEPIIPPVLEVTTQEETPEEVEEFLPEMDAEQLQLEMEALEQEQPEELAFLSDLVSDETAPSEETAAEVSEDVVTEEISEMLAQADELISHELPEPPVAPEPIDVPMPEPIVLEPVPMPEAEQTQEPVATEVADEQIPDTDPDTEDVQPVTEESPADITEAMPVEAAEEITAEALKEAEEITEEVTVEETIEESATETAEEAEEAIAEETPDEPVEETAEESQEETADAQPKPTAVEIPALLDAAPVKKQAEFHFPWKIAAAVLLMVALIALYFFGSHYYKNYYSYNVDSLVLRNTEDRLTVQLVCDADESLLKVVCTDIYGNAMESAVVGGIATFEQLNPNTRYTVRIEISGAHKLTGSITDTFTTPAQTQVLSFIAGMGPEDCSVALSFVVDGPESNSWIVTYSADGIEPKSETFTGHNVVIRNLVQGAKYTFTLSSPDGLYMAGQTQVSCTATNILAARDLTITACGGGSLTVQWQQPENGNVEQWNVRCFNNNGYDITIITSELSYTFTDLDHNSPCTVEVSAVGMDRIVNTFVPANPLTVENFQCAFTQDMTMHISWDYSGGIPEGGWILRCSIGGGTALTLQLEDACADLIAIPGGNYQFTIEAADESYVFGASQSYTADDVSVFAGYGVTIPDLKFQMYLLPEGDDLLWSDIPQENYTNSFAAGEQAGYIMALSVEPEQSENILAVQFVLHDANGRPVQRTSTEMVWKDMWQDGHCCIVMPEMPETAGTYTLSIYFDGCFVFLQEFSVV